MITQMRESLEALLVPAIKLCDLVETYIAGRREIQPSWAFEYSISEIHKDGVELVRNTCNEKGYNPGFVNHIVTIEDLLDVNFVGLRKSLAEEADKVAEWDRLNAEMKGKRARYGQGGGA